jgi:hypothetical protein
VADLSNYRLQRTANPRFDDSQDHRARVVWAVALVAAMAIAGGGAYYYRYGRHPVAPQAATAKPAPAAAAAELPRTLLGAGADAVDVPPLPESDPLVRRLLQSMSSHPRVVAWMATDGLIRNFTVVVDNIADGGTPARHLGVLKPAGRFKTTRDAGGLRIDPASYQRYDDLARAVDSVDPQAAARVYATLKPRIEEAHRELGAQEPFDRTLEEAIVRLVETPLARGDGRLAAKGAEAFQYTDQRLESLTDAQKLLLRMGPANARLVQEKLKAIGLALGIPTARLGGGL